jgi:hypothetical protein
VKTAWTLIGLAILGLLLGSGLGLAGDYHTSANLVCSDCHVMHYSEAHLYTGAPTPDPLLAPGGPFPSLLKNTVNGLCLACHDGRTDTPDVRGSNSSGYVRAAGQLNVQGDGNENTGHTLGGTGAPPGGTWTGNTSTGLLCIHCHNQHGNGYYRNLQSNPGTATSTFVTYLTGSTYTGTVALQQLASSPMTTHYATSNIRYRQSQVGTTDYGLSEWCSGCHGSFHGVGGTGNMGGSPTGDTNIGSPWLRHPTRGVTMSQGVTNKHVDSGHWFGTLQSRVPVVSPSGTIPGTSGASDNQPFCGSCHKAHGSTNKFGLIYDDETTATPEDGASLLQTCQQCHYQ